MSSIDGEVQLRTHQLGKEISDKLLRPCAFETLPVFTLDTGSFAVAIKFFPTANDPEFKEPIVILVREEDIENFIKVIRIAQAGTPLDVRKGGSA